MNIANKQAVFSSMKISILLCFSLLIFLSTAAFGFAANCGGTVPCSCGDTVITNTILDTAKDPVVTTVCSGDGLIVATGVTLDLGGNTIRGSLNREGIQIGKAASDINIKNGRVEGFYQGVKGLDVNSVTVTNIFSTKNRYFGIVLKGNNHRIENSIAVENGGRGMRIKGPNAIFVNNNSSRNGGYGFNVIGDNAVIKNNTCDDNGSDGIHVDGDDNLFEDNECRGNERHGIVTDDAINSVFRNNIVERNNFGFSILGNGGHLLEGNIANKNRGFGIYVRAPRNTLINNIANKNGQSGIKVAGGENVDGGGNDATGNKKEQCMIDGVACI